MRYVLCIVFVLSQLPSIGQSTLSVNLLKPVFYFAGKVDIMTDLAFDHYINKKFAIRLCLHGGTQNALSGLPLSFDNLGEVYTFDKIHSTVLGGSVGLKVHLKPLDWWPNTARFYSLFQTQIGTFIDHAEITQLKPCCFKRVFTFKSGFFKLGWSMGYDFRYKQFQLSPELGVMYPWASQIAFGPDKSLAWVNQTKFQWQIGLNLGYIFRKPASDNN